MLINNSRTLLRSVCKNVRFTPSVLNKQPSYVASRSIDRSSTSGAVVVMPLVRRYASLSGMYPEELKKPGTAAAANLQASSQEGSQRAGDSTGKGFDLVVPDFNGRIAPDAKLSVNKIVFNKKGDFVSEDDVVVELIYHSLSDIPLEIRPDIGAFIQSIVVKEGDRVKPGDVLARMVYAREDFDASEMKDPFSQLKEVASDLRFNPKKYKGIQENFARASSVGWSMIGGGIIIGLVLNWVYRKTHPEETEEVKKKRSAK